VAIGTVW